jgi:hypothetical protein
MNTQDIGEINDRENRRGQSRMSNPEALSTWRTQDTGKKSYVSFSCVLCTQCWQCLWIAHSWLPNSVFSNVYFSYVLCTQCWQYLWIIHSWSPPRFSLKSTWPVSCVINVDSAYGLPILDCPFGFLERLLVMCLVCPMLSVSLYWPFLIAPSLFSTVYLSCVLYVQCCLSLYWPFLIAPSVFSNVYLSCVLYVQCCLCLHWIYKTHDK